MPGTSNSVDGQAIIYSDNVDFTGAQIPTATVTTDGQLLIGRTTGQHIQVGSLTSPDASISIGYSDPNITLEAGGSVPTSFTTDSGTAFPVANNINILGLDGISTSAVGATVNVDLDASQTLTSAPANKDDIGGSTYFNDHFIVNSSTGFTQLQPGSIPSGATNLGITLSGGTTTIHGFDGTALSSTNPAFIWTQDRDNLGYWIRNTLTSNEGFDDSDLDSNTFGLDTGATPVSEIPFYIYYALDDSSTNGKFFLCRYPHYVKMPATSRIFHSGTTGSNDQRNMWCFDSITVGDYDGNPCTIVGCLSMIKTATTDDWTVQAFRTGIGINQFGESIYWDAPENQLGAAAGSYYIPNGGTPPSAPTGDYLYKLFRSGICQIEFQSGGITGGNTGSGAVTAQMYLPVYSNFDVPLGMAALQAPLGTYTDFIVGVKGGVFLTPVTFRSTQDASLLQWADFSPATARCSFNLNYQMANING